MHFVFFLIFLDSEYFEPKKLLDRLRINRYKSLEDMDFEITEHFYIRGVCKGFEIVICLTNQEKNGKEKQYYDIVETYYYPKCGYDNLREWERDMAARYDFGFLTYRNHIASFVPAPDDNIDYAKVINDFVAVLETKDLISMSRND